MKFLPTAWTAVLTLGASSALAAPPGPGPLGGDLAGAQPNARVAAESLLEAHLGAGVRVSWDDAWQAPRRVTGLAIATRGTDAATRVLGFLAATRKDFSAGDSTWRVTRVEPFPGGGTIVRCAVLLGGLPVEGREVVVQLDAAERVVRVTRDPGPMTLPNTPNAIDAARASALVFARYEVAAVGRATEVVLATTPGTERIAWRVPAARLPMSGHYFVWLDAETGATLRTGPAGFDEAASALPLRTERRQEGPR